MLQRDGSCSSLALGMTIHGLVCALRLVWIEVVYEARVCWLLLGVLPGAWWWDHGSKALALCFPGMPCSRSYPESRQKLHSSNLPQIQSIRGNKSNHGELLNMGENQSFPFVREGFRDKTSTMSALFVSGHCCLGVQTV